jgi:hypothetical protein
MFHTEKKSELGAKIRRELESVLSSYTIFGTRAARTFFSSKNRNELSD